MKMRILMWVGMICLCISFAEAQEVSKSIVLEKPDLARESQLMEAFSNRKSTRTFSERELSRADFSGLLWAANGINRPESGKRTAPSAMNKQDVKVYVCMKEGSYLYDPKKHALELVSEGDARQKTDAPVMLVLVSDTKDTWGALDAGIVSQNISLFCSGMQLGTVPRGSMDQDALRKALQLSDTQQLYLNHPVGYFR